MLPQQVNLGFNTYYLTDEVVSLLFIESKQVQVLSNYSAFMQFLQFFPY